MFGLPFIDIAVIIVYFAIVIVIGIRSSRRIETQEDYFLAGRRFGKFIQAFAAFGQATSADNSVASVVIVARNGCTGIWQMLTGVLQMPIFWITSVWYRRLRVLTLGDFFEERYGSKKIAGLYAIISAIFFMLIIGIGFVAMTKTVAAIATKPVEALSVEQRAERTLAQELIVLEKSDVALLTADQQERMDELRLQNPHENFSYINETIFMWSIALIVLLYAVTGGLEAAFLTDMMQGVLIMILSILLLPFAVLKINEVFGGVGLSGVVETARSQLPQSMFDLWGSPLLADFTWYYIIVVTIMTGVNVAVQANQLVATGSAKDEQTAQTGFCIGVYMKRVCTLLWGVTALLLVILYSKTVSEPEYIWGYACRDLLGQLKIGLVGLMIACLMAALMSTADALMITASSLLTRNLFRPMMPGLSEKTYVLAGRLFGFVVVVGGVLLACSFSKMIYLIKFLWEFNILFAASFWLGMKWRRANRAGAWASIGGTLVLFMLIPMLVPLLPGVRTNEYLLKTVDPVRIEKVYTARDIDVERRDAEIVRWEQLAANGIQKMECPKPLISGEKFNKVTLTPKISIFWTQGLGVTKDGRVKGRGLLSPELILLDKLGWDLSKNVYAFNETLRLVIRLLLPFFILVIVSLLTKRDDSERVKRLFSRLRTPTLADHEADASEVERSHNDTERFKESLLFPNSDWELFKMRKRDGIAFGIIVVSGALIFALLAIVAWIGRGG